MTKLNTRSYGTTEPTEQCRTCKGSGKITRKDKEGIAVISYGDERLAPSKTAIYIIIAVILFLALAGTLVVLFYPRTVSASSSRLSIIYANITQNDTILVLSDAINVQNNNYFSTYLTVINISVTYQKKEVGTNCSDYTGGNTTAPVTVSPRTTTTFSYGVNTTFTRQTGSDDIWSYCCNRTWKYNLPFQVQVNTKFRYFTTLFEFSDQMFHTAACPIISSRVNDTCYVYPQSGTAQQLNEDQSAY